MAALSQFTYIFAISVLFAFLDAWNIGANDVANSFATSVSSRSLTLPQAMIIASICEFAGAVLVGARVADTIRNKIIDVQAFELEPSVLMLGMLCALVGSSTWLTIATKVGMPVSTTHCIVGGLIGVGVAALGWDGVVWGWKGVSQIFAAWGIAPGIAGGFGAITFLITKFLVLKRKNSLRAGLPMVPIYFALTSGILTMVIVWKGAPSLKLDKWTTGQTVGCILGVAFGVATLCTVFFVPWLYRLLVKEDWQLRWYHIVQGPLLLKRGPVAQRPDGEPREMVKNYYSGHKTREELERDGYSARQITDLESSGKADSQGNISVTAEPTSSRVESPSAKGQLPAKEEECASSVLTQEKWYTPRNLLKKAWYFFMRGVRVDVVAEQQGGGGGNRSRLAGNLENTHARTEHFDNKTEHLYSFLQVMTAATSSFAHGSNDVSNAMGPLATIYLIWDTGMLSNKAPVPIWVLVFGASAIVIGLWTYGYNLMRNLGNRITLHSPSRGFSMELGSALTVILATRYGLPVSTTQCIIGATVGVGLCTGDLRAINWRMVAWAYAGWLVTLPVTAVISGCIMGFVINAPQWGKLIL